MKHFKRNNFIITTTMIVCMVLCLLWATVFFVRHAKEAAESSAESSAEETSPVEEIVLPDATDALLTCNDRILNATSFSAVTTGHCDTQIMFFNYRHELFSERYVNGGTVYNADYGLGAHIRYAVSTYCEGDSRLVRLGNINSIDNVIWNDKTISLTKNAYTDALGQVQRGLSSYLIDKKSILSAKLKAYAEDTYTFVYELEPLHSSEYYAKKLQQYGALDETPVFDSIKMTVVMDHDFYPISVTYQETYSISLSMIGETTCKAEYTETFSDFEGQVVIPDKEYFQSNFSMVAVDTCPELSAGYQLLLSFFEDSVVYALDLNISDLALSAELSVDKADGSLQMCSELFDFLYQNDRYHFSHGEFCVFTEAEALNSQLLPLFSVSSSSERAKNESGSDMLSGAEIKTEDGVLYISSSNDGNTMLIKIDTATMSLISAELQFELSDSDFEIKLIKTEKTASQINKFDYVDITESVPAVSFLTTLLTRTDGQYVLTTGGMAGYQANIIVSGNKDLAFSAISASDKIPIDLYYANNEMSIVCNDIALQGSLDDFFAIIDAIADNGVSTVSTNSFVRLAHMSSGPNRITLGFDGKVSFSVTMTSKSILISSNRFDVMLADQGISNIPPFDVPAISNTVTASFVSEYLQESFVPTIIGAKGIGAYLELNFNGEKLSGDFLVGLSSNPTAQFDTNLSGLDASIILGGNTFYISTPILNAFVDLERADSVLKRLAAFANQSNASPANTNSLEGISVSCDGTEIRVRYRAIEIVFQKNAVIINSESFAISADCIIPVYERPNITHPNKSECINLDLLSQRLVPLGGQTSFAFSGIVSGDIISASIPRLDICLNRSLEISSAAIDLLLNDEADVIHIVYDDDALFFENSNCKLFCLAEPLFSVLNSSMPQSAAYGSDQQMFDIGSIRSVTYYDDTLRIQTDAFVISIELCNSGLEAIELSNEQIQLTLRSIAVSPITIPRLEGYVDVTSACELLPKLINTSEAGNFNFDGNFDLETLSMRLKGIALRGTVDFSDEIFKAYACIEVPYFYGLTSGDISLKQGNSLLKNCTIKSEIYVLEDKVYLCRTIYATYGYSQPTKLVYTEKKYMTVGELFLSPEKMLAFVLNLDPDLQLTSDEDVVAMLVGSFEGYGLFKRYAKQGNKYVLEFNPDALSSNADGLAVYTEADDLFISKCGIETTISLLTVNLYCNLTDHGLSELSFDHDDFSAYTPLQD